MPTAAGPASAAGAPLDAVPVDVLAAAAAAAAALRGGASEVAGGGAEETSSQAAPRPEEPAEPDAPKG